MPCLLLGRFSRRFGNARVSRHGSASTTTPAGTSAGQPPDPQNWHWTSLRGHDNEGGDRRHLGVHQ